MLSYFYQHKGKYEKGQMAPFFILILVIVMIMAMVSLNLSKVASIKTASSNSVDAGSLSGASVMANVFNGIAQANSEMEKLYWEFFASVSGSFAIAFGELITAHLSASAALLPAGIALDLACVAPCGAIASAEAAKNLVANAIFWLEFFWGTAISISTAVTAFAAAQLYFYKSIRRTAKDGRDQAIEIAHRFAFINSGLGSKLKEGSPPAEITEAPKKNNYREEFSRFLDNLEHSSSYIYPWVDGAARNHSVETEVSIAEVRDYQLRVTALPLPVELGLLITSIIFGRGAAKALGAAAISYGAAAAFLAEACFCFNLRHLPYVGPKFMACYLAACAKAEKALAVGMTKNTAGIASIIPIYPLMGSALAGLAPAPFTFRSSDDLDALPFIITWIDDIEHDRRLRVDTAQEHQGGDLGLWQTRYSAQNKANIEGFSIADFRGRGSIHPPRFRHDSSIVATDTLQPSSDSLAICDYVRSQISALEQRISELEAGAEDYDVQADSLEREAQRLRSLNPPMQEEADQLSQSAADLRIRAEQSREQADSYAEEIEGYRNDNQHCF